MIAYALPRLPEGTEALAELALDAFWSWSHSADALWRTIDPETWERTRNPWIILRDLGAERLGALASDQGFRRLLERAVEERRHYLERDCWCDQAFPALTRGVAYFCMEFGLGQALPLYAGGLGVLAGDYLKGASDLGLPAVGVGLLYQEGYFRQFLDRDGWQQEIYTHNDPGDMPLQPAVTDAGERLKVALELPGRTVLLRVWQALVGRRRLLLLDSNDPRNAPLDRGITAKLYGGGTEARLLQEIVLGIGGWRAIEALGIAVEVCHLNEGHAALAAIERARSCMAAERVSFSEALWATRAGNLFTTHTPVAAGFDRFSPALIEQYFCTAGGIADSLGLGPREFLALGRADADDDGEPFNMATLAIRCSGAVNAVSRTHEEVSRRLFAPLFPRWPLAEVPLGHVTNGVHTPTWDSAEADALWTEACGKERWLGGTAPLGGAIACLSDEAIWELRARERTRLVAIARSRLQRQLGQRGASRAQLAEAQSVLDPNTLTLGFARRFTDYKRPNLLLSQPERLVHLLTRAERPVQLLLAGKAHPEDLAGKRLLQAWSRFAADPRVRRHVVLLEDYDLGLAEDLVQGVDVWINTPRRPWEACGTSGMKVLVNGGLNLSVRDGWWAEAYEPRLGWTIGEGAGDDGAHAEELYRVLEEEVIPEFYAHDERGLPRAWIARIRASMAELVPRFSVNRMIEDYIRDFYGPAAAALAERRRDGAALSRALEDWRRSLEADWERIHFGTLEVVPAEGRLRFVLPVYLGEIAPERVRVELYAEPLTDDPGGPVAMTSEAAIPGAVNGFLFTAELATERPAEHFTPRVVPHHGAARTPLECSLIRWYR